MRLAYAIAMSLLMFEVPSFPETIQPKDFLQVKLIGIFYESMRMSSDLESKFTIKCLQPLS